MGSSCSAQEVSELKLAASTNFTNEELRQLLDNFKAVDKDKSGDLDYNEFEKLWSKIPALRYLKEAQLQKLFALFDTDHSNTISFAELAVAFSLLHKGTTEQKLSALFDIFDTNGNGILDSREITQIVIRMQAINTLLQVSAPLPESQQCITKLQENLRANKQVTREKWVTIASASPGILALLV